MDGRGWRPMGDDMRDMGDAGDKKARGGHDPFKIQPPGPGMGGPAGMSKVGAGMGGGPGAGMGMELGHQRLPMMVSMPSVCGAAAVALFAATSRVTMNAAMPEYAREAMRSQTACVARCAARRW